MKHWVYKYLRKRWTETYDCFAHFVEVQREQFGITDLETLPDQPPLLDFDGAMEYVEHNPAWASLWEQVEQPRHGDAVVFGDGKINFHIGTWLDVDGGGILHCQFGTGVTFTPRPSITLSHIKVKHFFRHK